MTAPSSLLSRNALRRSQKVTEMLLALHHRQSMALLEEEEFDEVDTHSSKAAAAAAAATEGDDPDFDMTQVEQLLREMTTVVNQGDRPLPSQGRTGRAIVDTLSHVTASNAKLNNAILTWEHPVHNILIIKKRGDANVANWFGSVANHLVQTYPEVSVFFPPRLFREDVEALKRSKEYTGRRSRVTCLFVCSCLLACLLDKCLVVCLLACHFCGMLACSLLPDYPRQLIGLFRKLHTWEASRTFAEVAQELAFDLVVCLGGDGTLLHMASLFQSEVPPVMCFALGSLGRLGDWRRWRRLSTELAHA